MKNFIMGFLTASVFFLSYVVYIGPEFKAQDIKIEFKPIIIPSLDNFQTMPPAKPIPDPRFNSILV